MTTFDQLLFLPGASGNTQFWVPVAEQLDLPVARTAHLAWPGFGPTPADPAINSLPALAQSVIDRITVPTALVAQSMGGVLALLAALEKPTLVTHLVLAALSGGIDVKRHGARDWRPPREEIDASNPAHLFAAYDRDLTPLLSAIEIPVLLLWGDDDAISPVSVGEWLREVFPRAEMRVVRGGGHSFCQTQPGEVVPHIRWHLSGASL